MILRHLQPGFTISIWRHRKGQQPEHKPSAAAQLERRCHRSGRRWPVRRHDWRSQDRLSPPRKTQKSVHRSTLWCCRLRIFVFGTVPFVHYSLTLHHVSKSSHRLEIRAYTINQPPYCNRRMYICWSFDRRLGCRCSGCHGPTTTYQCIFRIYSQ